MSWFVLIAALATVIGLAAPSPAHAAGAQKVVIAWNPSHQNDNGDAAWHEYAVCGDIVKRAMALLPDYTNVLCWETGMGLTSHNTAAMAAEVATANAAGAQVFISIHVNGGTPSGIGGDVWHTDALSLRYCDAMVASMHGYTGLRARYTLLRDDLYVLNPAYNKAPVRVLFEMGDNISDRALLDSATGRQMLAAGLAKAVRDNTPPTWRYEQPDPHAVYTGTWTASSASYASGGSLRYANAAGSAVTVPFWGTRLVWIAAKGPGAGLARVTLDGGAPVTVDLFSSTALWKRNVWDSGTLTQGPHKVKIEYTGLKTSGATGASVNVDAFDIRGFIGTRPIPSASFATRYEQTSSNITRSGTWTSVSTTSASAGSYAYADSAASAVIWFIGNRLDWIATKGASLGKAKVVLDGAAPVGVDLYASTASYKQKVWSTGTLPWGTHWVKISWTGVSSGGGTRIDLDAVDVWGGLIVPPATVTYQENAAGLVYAGSWTKLENPNASGGLWTWADSAGLSVTVRFTGASLTWLGKKAPTAGIARVTLDDMAPVTVNLYNATAVWMQSLWSTGDLRWGAHTLKIEWTGTPGAAGGGTVVNVDGFVVRGDLTSGP